MKKCCWLLIGILLCTAVAAQTPESEEGDSYGETVTVTASLTPVSLDEIGSSVTVIDRAEIAMRSVMRRIASSVFP